MGRQLKVGNGNEGMSSSSQSQSSSFHALIMQAVSRYILLCSLVHLLGRRREKELSLVWNRYFPYKSHLKMGKIFGNP